MGIEHQVDLAIKRAIIEELENIMAEIEELDADFDFEGFYYCQSEIFKIIENHISELKGENK